MRGILFDKDGTLLDFEASWGHAYRELVRDLAGSEALAEAMLDAGGYDLATGLIRPGSVLAVGNSVDMARLWFPDHDDIEHRAMVAAIDMVFHANGLRYSVAVDGLFETLAELAEAGMVMGIATSDGTAAARAAIEMLGVHGHLPPDIVYAFAAATEIPPAEIAVVGDSTHDLAMARAAGAGLAIGVLSGTSGHDDLVHLADVILPSIRELPAYLAQNRK
jgi:phosphoglycolate phosphatase